jgi:hypothetical protein
MLLTKGGKIMNKKKLENLLLELRKEIIAKENEINVHLDILNMDDWKEYENEREWYNDGIKFAIKRIKRILREY